MSTNQIVSNVSRNCIVQVEAESDCLLVTGFELAVDESLVSAENCQLGTGGSTAPLHCQASLFTHTAQTFTFHPYPCVLPIHVHIKQCT